MRFEALWEHYWRVAKPSGPSTQVNYTMWANNYVLPTFGAQPINTISRPQASEWLASLEEMGKGYATRRACRNLLCVVMNFAVDEGRLPSNPVARIRLTRDEYDEASVEH